MAFRRRSFRRTFRRSPYELKTIVECRHGISIPPNSTCQSPFIDSIFIAGTQTAAGSEELPRVGVRGYTFGGAHFQAEHALVNLTSASVDIVTVIGIFEALVHLPYAQGQFGVPAYLPLLTNAGFTAPESSDRVLWKRYSELSFFSADILPNGQISTTVAEDGHGPLIVKAKCTLDDRHGLFYVGAYVHGDTEFTINVARNTWWKVAVKERRR